MSKPSRPPGGLVLRLLLAELRASLRNARRRDLAWVFLGGGGLAAYAIGIVLLGIRARSEMLLAAPLIWWVALPAAMIVTGALTGLEMARLAQSRAYAPFLKTQPLGEPDRRRMARVAAFALGLPLVAIDAALVTAMIAAAGQTAPLLWGLGALFAATAGLGLAITLRLRLTWRDPALTAHGSALRRSGFSIAMLDDRRPRWLGSWAGGFVSGKVRVTPRGILAALFFAASGALLATASIVQSDPAPAILGGVVGGLVIYMLTLRGAPLLSPVLRASALSFTRAVRGLIRLPLLLSALFFAALAAPAYAAEPGMVAMPLSGALGLLILNGIYTAFAAFFARSRRLAALAFAAALALTAYETLEYGRTILVALAALVIFLWLRARKAYRHG